MHSIDTFTAARMSRECGELRLRLEKAESDLMKSSSSSKQEATRLKSICGEIWKRLDTLPADPAARPSAQKLVNESTSSELARIEKRVGYIVSRLEESGFNGGEERLKEKDAQIRRLEETLEAKEAELNKMSKDFSIKLVEMKNKIDLLNDELDTLKDRDDDLMDLKASPPTKVAGRLPPPTISR